MDPASPAPRLLLLGAALLALLGLFEALDGVREHAWHIALSTLGAAALLLARGWLMRRADGAKGA